MKIKKIISILLFSIGLGFILYPLISKSYYDNYYRLEAEKIEQRLKDNDDAEMNALYDKQFEYNQTGFTDLDDIEVADVGFVEDDESLGEGVTLDDAGVLGIVSIPKIDLTYPILDGATDENLANGVARIEGTSYPVGGKNTNSVISGHNGWAGKTFFSKLTQLEKGDLVEIRNQKETLSYEVYDTAVIEPTDVEALAIVPGQDIVTLLTCTYPPPGTHRYLVFGKRVDTKPEAEDTTASVADKESIDTADRFSLIDYVNLYLKRYGSIVLVLFLGLLGMYFIFFRSSIAKEKRK